MPALQRSQRDTQRRDDLSRVATALTQYQTNNNGQLPTNTQKDKFLNKYLKKSDTGTSEEFNDPDGEAYKLNIAAITGTATTDVISSKTSVDHTIYIRTAAKCSVLDSKKDKGGEGYVQGTGKKNNYAILYVLEGSGTYCADNQ